MMWERSQQGRWAYWPSLAGPISKPRALHQKLAFGSTAGRSPSAGYAVAEKDCSSPLVNEYDKHIRLYLCCRQHKTLKELHQAISEPESLDYVYILRTGLCLCGWWCSVCFLHFLKWLVFAGNLLHNFLSCNSNECLPPLPPVAEEREDLLLLNLHTS